MKRYLVFAGDDYEALGGWHEYRDSFDVLPLAIQNARRSMYVRGRGGNDWAHIVDTKTMAIVFELGRKNGKIAGEMVS